MWRDSVSDLVRRLGYVSHPASACLFAFELRGDEPVTIPSAFRLAAEVTGRDCKSDFETTDEVLAWPAFSHFSLYRPAYFPNIAAGTSRFSTDTAALAAAGVTIEKGNRLIIAHGSRGTVLSSPLVGPSDDYDERACD